MNIRKKKLLQIVVEHYIETAIPVGSKAITDMGALDVSGATVRNELRSLEEEGYLTHPHTSSGRVPTEKGYKFYIEHLMEEKKANKKGQKEMEALIAEIEDDVKKTKHIAKYISISAQNAVIVAFGKDRLYYTGMAHLFSQPEFQNYAHTVDVSTIFDECENRIGMLYDTIKVQEVEILVGSDNPLGAACSVIISRPKEGVIMSLMGPMRMDYKSGVQLLQAMQQIINI